MRVELLVIDPQKDFCDPNGNLFVPGANEDMKRLSVMVDRLKGKIDDIHVTLDSHHYIDIAHPVFWLNSDGKNPDPFTLISVEDVENGNWKTTNPQYNKRALEYVKSLRDNKRYGLCIWPPHCLIGSDGYSVFPELYKSLIDWEKQFAMVNYITKGSNMWTEHYSAVQADVIDPEDPGTLLNMNLIEVLENADIILLSGEALSHCLANTVTDIADNFGDNNIKKLVLLTDTTSSVPGFENLGDDFIKNMTARGMQTDLSTNFLI